MAEILTLKRPPGTLEERPAAPTPDGERLLLSLAPSVASEVARRTEKARKRAQAALARLKVKGHTGMCACNLCAAGRDVLVATTQLLVVLKQLSGKSE